MKQTHSQVQVPNSEDFSPSFIPTHNADPQDDNILTVSNLERVQLFLTKRCIS